jgi:hypothetical protein
MTGSKRAMTVTRDHGWLLTSCEDCEWGYAAVDLDAASDAFDDHVRSRHE